MKSTVALLAILGVLAVTTPGFAADKKSKAKPYPLKTCIVSDEAFDGHEGKPYVFEHEGQEIKLCCKPCLKDFKKDTAKYMKKIEDAQKKKS